jgi:hypothetical protein
MAAENLEEPGISLFTYVLFNSGVVSTDCVPLHRRTTTDIGKGYCSII